MSRICEGTVWNSWRYERCPQPATVVVDGHYYCGKPLCRHPEPEPPAVAEAPDESRCAREQLASRFAGRIAERMHWGNVVVEGDAIILTAEQAAELAEKLGG